MKKVALYLGSLFVLAFGVGGIIGATVPTGTADAACGTFLTFPAWYEGLTTGDCEIQGPDASNRDGLTQYIWTIILNVIEIMLQAVCYIAVGFVIYGGFLYITSGNSPDGRARALKTVVNALIGFAIAIAAVAVKNLIWDNILRGAGGTSAPVIEAGGVVQNILNLIYTLVAIAAVVVIIISSINMATSAGDPGKAAKARTGIVSAVIGIVVVIAAFAITTFIAERFYG